MKLVCPKCSHIFPAGADDDGGEVTCPECGAPTKRPSGAEPGVVLGDFLIEKRISSGGMGDIFVARQLSLDREVALKVLQKKFSGDPEFADALLHEARAAAKLNHPNIVQAYAVGEEDGVFYFAMEYIRGETYKEILRRKKRLDALEAAKVVLDVARALDAAWGQQKLVHQDIKPENIMRDANGFSKLADLGLARRAGSEKETSGDEEEVMGTPQYISPEQLTGVPTDVRSDMYSLGATFYHFVTGRFPYVAPTTEEITRMHVEGHLQPPVEVYDHLPAEINRIIVKMMARDPGDRYQTPAELIADLESFIRGEAGETTRNVKVRRPWSRKKKLIVALSAALLTLIFAAGIFSAGVLLDGNAETPQWAQPFCRGCGNVWHRGTGKLVFWCKKLPFCRPETTEAPAVVVETSVLRTPAAAQTRDAMLRRGRGLIARVRRGENSSALLGDFDEYCVIFAEPRTGEETQMLRDVIGALSPLDEKMRFADVRQKERLFFDRNMEKLRAVRETEKRRAEAEKRHREEALQAQRRAEHAAREQAAAELEKFRGELQKNAVALFAGFLRCADKNDAAAFSRAVKKEIPLPSGAEAQAAAQELASFAEYRDALAAIYPEYTAFLAGIKNLENLRISVSLSGSGIAQILTVSPDRKATFRAANGKIFDFMLDESHRGETVRFLTTLGRTLKMLDASGNRAIFYYALYTGNPTDAALRAAPGDFWKKYAKKWNLDFPKR